MHASSELKAGELTVFFSSRLLIGIRNNKILQKLFHRFDPLRHGGQGIKN